jgi:hypothetical protein
VPSGATVSVPRRRFPGKAVAIVVVILLVLVLIGIL